ncbi:tripartite tricarboxylate transporter TctB family protein [Vibrio sp. JC009]|uniref:tripartite tricarboxylate transporter TctB family protein n=1 Tax=Vibrio sp. JC009 TaxID=2912314 RepID=UPI0023B06CE1|nr:tripartite tricarboxylate transporter TctB family protein [Vibrio sp. JC009]WED24030.1 tripartite tricarboxylate transporter TctB family protein [Vibrio sp. JC009]
MLKRKSISIIFLFFGLFLIGYSSYSLGDIGTFGAAFMPTLSGIGIVLFAITDFYCGEDKEENFSADFKYVSIISVLILFYVLASEYLGFIFTSFIVVGPLMATYAKCGIKKSVVISLAVVVCIYYLFANVLLVPLPQLFS